MFFVILAPPSYEEAMRLAIAASVESATPTTANIAVSDDLPRVHTTPTNTTTENAAATAQPTTVIVEAPKPSSC